MMNMVIKRRQTREVNVGSVRVGSPAPIVVQSMTNTDTADIDKTLEQILALSKAGSEIVRVTVNTAEAAQSLPVIVKELRRQSCTTPIVGDFHFNGHKLLTEFPECAKALDKYRINPGNVGRGSKRDEQFATLIALAVQYDKPIRIGVNWGSLDQEMLARFMDENAKQANPLSIEELTRQALIASALDSAKMAHQLGLAEDKIILSCKVSGVQDLILVYRDLAQRCDYPLHLGLTEAGMGSKGIVASSAAMGILLQEGIGDTIRVSLTPEPNGDRTLEVRVAQELLQTMGIRAFTPMVTACPGCGRTTSTYFQELADDIQTFLRDSMPVWRTQYKGVENLHVAVMGCVVNGPGESKLANIGISLPGSGERPVAPVYVDGEKTVTLKGDSIAAEFKSIVINYIQNKYQ